jgi:translation initiation factor 1
MPDICPNCGLPTELCVCNVLEKETEQRIKVYSKKAKFNRVVTIIEGIGHDDLERTAKSLKRILACGGTFRNTIIELQGDHSDTVKKALISIGYKESNIEVA